MKGRGRPSRKRSRRRPRLVPLTPDFRERLHAAFAAAGKRLWCYYFPFLYCYGRTSGREVLYASCGDSHVLFLEREGRRGRSLDLVVPPVPLTAEAWDFARGVIAMRRRPRPGRVLWVDERDREFLAARGLEVVEKEREYLIEPARIIAPDADLPRRLRRKLAMAAEEPLRVVPYSAEHIGDAWNLHERLAQESDPDMPLLDYDYTGECLSRAPRLMRHGMIGLAALCADRLAGFAFGGPMSPELANFFILKTDPDVPGLAEWLRVEFLRRLAAYPLVNDASDLGREGLAQHKRQFLPVRMLQAWTVRSVGGR
jgi:hypothetical protein